ncbi:hypothetical protein VTN00DRAFT_152 [Thermoascus crustaceus]|uniref:uncharacterized protein n=1 Tax=Thermoascus crustaceus TaxID=5088 RepID=UPI003741EBB7
MSSFAFLRAYDDLITAICCVGAVYSNRTDLSQVQGLVKLSEAAIERTSRVQKLLRTSLAVNRDQAANNATHHLSEGFTGALGPVDRTCLEVASGSRLCSDVGLLARLVCRFVLPIGLQVAGTRVFTAISTLLRRMISQFGTGDCRFNGPGSCNACIRNVSANGWDFLQVRTIIGSFPMFFPIGIPLQRVPHGGDFNVFSFPSIMSGQMVGRVVYPASIQ